METTHIQEALDPTVDNTPSTWSETVSSKKKSSKSRSSRRRAVKAAAKKSFKNGDSDLCYQYSEQLVISEKVSQITDLPDDVLYLIFRFLPTTDLCCLCCVNWRFHHLTSKDSVWLSHARKLVLVQTQYGLINHNCSVKELCRIAPSWTNGYFKENLYAKDKKKSIPWIVKDSTDIWLSKGNSICCFKAKSTGLPTECHESCLLGLKGDVTKFAVKNDKVFSGCRNGDIFGWDTLNFRRVHYKNVHETEAHCVDFTQDVWISGSKDGSCKIAAMHDFRETDVVFENVDCRSVDAGERVWTLKISPCQRVFAAGLEGHNLPVMLWDIESLASLGDFGANHRQGAGVLDMLFESPNELLTCSYDTFLRRWDLRTMTCVAQWEEPQDSALYCVATDGHYARAVGTARHGMVRMWDTRMTEPVQCYYSHQSQSPVYGIAMDNRRLYLALERSMNVMSFDVSSSYIKKKQNNVSPDDEWWGKISLN